ncbi:MAG: hypothetical protein HYY24_22605 [Verrucomicrobia bacterium]|nr:hypothetical protein [Verrucomicrobiota bacterium]
MNTSLHTSNGITADLEAMQRVGLGGAPIMEVHSGLLGPVRLVVTARQQIKL